MVAAIVVCSITFDFFIEHIPILRRHHQSGFSVLGMLTGLQLSKILGLHYGLITMKSAE